MSLIGERTWFGVATGVMIAFLPGDFIYTLYIPPICVLFILEEQNQYELCPCVQTWPY